MSARAFLRGSLIHLNVLLAMFAGCMLATSARLWLDPSAYLILRAVWPTQWAVLAASSLSVATGQLALVHLVMLHRAAYRMYCAGAAALLFGESCVVCWLWLSVRDWLRSPAAADLARWVRLARQLVRLPELLPELLPDLPPLTEIRPVVPWLPEERHVKTLLQEIEGDLRRLLATSLAVCASFVCIQVVCIALSAALCRPLSVRLVAEKHLPRDRATLMVRER